MRKGLIVSVCAAVALFGSSLIGDDSIVKPQSVSAQSASCPGDFNGDGAVNLADFSLLRGRSALGPRMPISMTAWT